jgi:anaerobic selenocysteine-containing dehydrogenase
VESARRGDSEPRYPLYFMTPNTKNRIHSQFNNLETIRRLSPKPTLTIHPDDAKRRGIVDGALVRVFNDRGYVEVEASVDMGIRAGCVSMTNGWWITQGGTVNFCSFGRETDMGHGAAFHENLVEVRAAQ